MDSLLKKRATLLLIVTALLLLAVAGCATLGGPASVKMINKQEFETLQKASKKLARLIGDLRGAIQTQEPVNERNARVEEVFTKYSRDFPQIQNLNAPGMLPENEKKALRGTISGELLALYLQGEKGKNGDEVTQAGTPAAPVALQYLGALNALYGLQEFESYMAQHTAGDGTKPNPQDPPVSMGGAQAFGWSGIGLTPMGDYVGVTVGFDPGPGIVRYWMSWPDYDSLAPAPEVNPSMVERAILQHGEGLAREADSMLVQYAEP